MRRSARWLWRGVLLTGLALAAGVALYVWALPWYAERVVRDALVGAGFTQASFTLGRVTFDHLQLTDLQLDDAGRARAAAVTVRFRPGELWHGRLDEVIVHDARWQIHIGDELDLAPLHGFRLSDGATDGPFAIGRVELRAASVQVHEGDRVWNVPIDATLTRTVAGLHLAGSLNPQNPTPPHSDAWRAGEPLLSSPVRFGGEWRWLNETANGAFELPRLQAALQPGSPLTAAIAEHLGARVTGLLDLEARLRLTPAGVEPSLEVALQRGELRGPDGLLRLNGLAGRIALDRFAPLRSEGGQRVTWQSVTLGDFEMAAGSLILTMEAPDAILVEQLSLGMVDGGRLWAHSFRLDPADVDTRVDLFLENVPLEGWLSLITLDHMQGRGRLSGRLPLRIRSRPHVRISVGEGYLQAESGGRVRLLDRAAAEQAIDEQAGGISQLGLSDEIQQRVMEALQDYEYDALRFDLLRDETGTLLMRVFTRGRGRAGERQEIGSLTLNVRNADALLNLAVHVKLGWDRAQDRLRLNRLSPRDTPVDGAAEDAAHGIGDDAEPSGRTRMARATNPERVGVV